MVASVEHWSGTHGGAVKGKNLSVPIINKLESHFSGIAKLLERLKYMYSRSTV